MKKLFGLILLFQLFGTTLSAENLPEWITQTDRFCSPQELCAVGYGEGLLTAENAAKQSLASIFETRIQSQSSSQSQMQMSGTEGSTQETFQKNIKETVDQMLKGVEVKEKFNASLGFYVLVKMTKEKAGTVIASKIDILTDQMNAHLKKNTRSSINQALQDFYTREALKERYLILTGQEYVTSLSLAQILEEKNKKMLKKVLVKLEAEKSEEIKELFGFVSKKLMQNEFVLAEKGANLFDYRLKLSINAQDQYFKVKGFKKFKFNFKGVSYNNQGQKIGRWEIVSQQTCRAFDQCLNQANEEIRSEIEKDFDSINID